MDSVNIETGEKHVAINGDPNRVIVFNPEDRLFIEKFYKLLPEIQSQSKIFEKREAEIMKESGVDDLGIPIAFQEILNLQKEVCVYMREKIDRVFGEGTSQTVFEDALSPFAIIQFLEGVTPFIEQVRSEKIQKHTRSYTKSGIKVMK